MRYIGKFHYLLAAILDFRKSKFQPAHVTRGIKRSTVSKFHGPTIGNCPKAIKENA